MIIFWYAFFLYLLSLIFYLLLLGMCYILYMSSSVYVVLGNVSHFFLVFHVSLIFVSIVGRFFGTCFFTDGFLFLVKELGLLTNPGHWVRVLDAAGSYMYIVL
jgi:hypothetical protein